MPQVDGYTPDVEKKDGDALHAVMSTDKDIQDATDRLSITHEGDHDMKRDLKPRHVSMIAIAGTIGTGLFLSSGAALTTGGPVGMWIGFTVMGFMVGCMMYCLGEMMCFEPNVGAYIEMCHNYIDPAAGYLVAFNAMLQGTIAVPTEVSAVGMLAGYWDHNNAHLPAYLAAALFLLVACNLIGVKYYGEVEFFFAFLKLITLVGLIIFGIVYNAGGVPPHQYIGGRYWRHEPFNDTFMGLKPVGKARFLGFWAVLTRAAFSYSGIETLALLAGEAHNPRNTMRMAVRTVFYRVVGIYMLSVLIIGLNVSQKDPMLLNAVATGGATAASSPFVVMCQRAGIQVLPHIINAVVLTSAWSAANENVYAYARFTMGLARQGWLPKKIYLKTLNGVPAAGVATAAAAGCLSFMAASKGSAQVFLWFSNLNALCALVTWIMVCAAYTRFYRALKVQGIDRRNLPFRSFGQPYLAWICIATFSTVIFFNGFPSFIGKFQAEDFVASYITLPIIFTAWLGYKVIKRSKLRPLDQIDFSRGPAQALVNTHYDTHGLLGQV